MPKDTFHNLKSPKKDKIIEAIINELSLHTYEHINVANIIRDSKISRGSFYQYFEDKEDLYQFFISYVGKIKYEMFYDLFDVTIDMPFVSRLKKMYLRSFVFAQKYPKLVRAGYHFTQSDVFRQSETYEQIAKSGLDFFIELIDKDQQLGLIRKDIDTTLLASAIIDYMNKMDADHYINPHSTPIDIEKRIDFIMDILRKGIE